MNATTELSVILPVLNEAAHIAPILSALAPLRRRGAEVIVVDGGSDDATLAQARPHADTVVMSARGRAAQMNAGARLAHGRVLLFLHADTRLPPQADEQIRRALADESHDWGRFDIRIQGADRLLPIIAGLINCRSRLTGIATGDQGLFVTRCAFDRVGGFPRQALMEDIELCRRLKRLSRPVCLRATATTSGRRWEQSGALRTIALMWALRLGYYCGAPPARLARWYRHAR